MKALISALIFLGMLAGPAAAQNLPNPWYVGAQGGLAKYKETCENRAGVCDQTDIAYRLFGGYRFSKYWSAEFGWFDLGEAKVDGATGGVMTYQVSGFDIVGLLMAPLSERMSAYAKFGAHRVRTIVNSTLPGGSDAADNSSAWVGGGGLQYDFGGRLGLRAEWQRYWSVGAANTGEDDIDVYSLGLLFRF